MLRVLPITNKKKGDTGIADNKLLISIIIPAYNEETRLPVFLSNLTHWCRQRRESFEILVIDDGSKDNTVNLADDFRRDFPNLRVISLGRNYGKGAAIRKGMLSAKGNCVAFFDADGAVSPEALEKALPAVMSGSVDIFVGSRIKHSSNQILKVRFHRKLMGSLYNLIIRLILFKEIFDTQCGFKVFTQEAAHFLFSKNKLNGFGFDLEILYMASRVGFKIQEEAVSWQEVRGSKVHLIIDSCKMLWNVFQIRWWHYNLCLHDPEVQAKRKSTRV